MIFRSPWPDIETSSGSISDAVLGAARRFGDKPAIIEGETGRTLTYSEFVRGTERVAAGLVAAGLKPGEPLALALPNCIKFVLALHGALLAGSWVVPISPLYTAPEMEHQIHDSGARFLITVSERAAAIQHAVEHLFVIGRQQNDCGSSQKLTQN